MVKTVIMICLLCLGCTAKTITDTVYVTEYKDVYIPVKCEIDIPQKPVYIEGEAFPSLINRILKSYDELENLLEYCRGGKDER